MFPPVPANESERLTALDRDAIVEMPEPFDELARLASTSCSTPIAQISLIDSLIATRLDGVIESVNAATERIFGYTAHELVGRMLETLLDGFDAEWALGRVIECDAVRKDGSHFPCELSLFEFSGSSGTRVVGHIRDVSERHELERMKRDFISTVSHELRTPLTSIHGSLGLLASGVMGDLPREAKAMVSVAQRNSVRLLALINDILDFDKLESGKIEMHLRPTSLMPILERAIEMIRPLAAQDGVTIELKGIHAQVLGDESRLGQVVANFLSNAVRYSPRDGIVTVAVASLDEVLEVRVQDRGRGIDADLQKKLFQRFHRADSGDAWTGPGAGLGLAICKAIVDQHGGTIGVASREGEGSTFWFRIPRAVEEPDVLLIEEDAVLLDAMTAQLLAGGLNVRTACSGWSGLAAVGERSPSLIVLDVDLRDIDGYGVVAELRNDPAHRRVPLIVFSGNDLSAMERYRLRLGPTRFLTRSLLAHTQLRATVDQLLDGCRVREGA